MVCGLAVVLTWPYFRSFFSNSNWNPWMNHFSKASSLLIRDLNLLGTTKFRGAIDFRENEYSFWNSSHDFRGFIEFFTHNFFGVKIPCLFNLYHFYIDSGTQLLLLGKMSWALKSLWNKIVLKGTKNVRFKNIKRFNQQWLTLKRGIHFKEDD